jgi:hypothetical protein
MPETICRPCVGLPCVNPDDLASGIDGAFYSALDFSFIVQCPEHCFCPDGLFPQTISILASTIPPVVPPIDEPGTPIILRLQGCSAIITRTLTAGSSQTVIAAAAQSMQAEWAGQQALCLALQVPGVNCDTGTSISVCNDAQTGWCGDVVAAGTICQNLNTTGLTQTQIDAATATIKANLNQQATARNCAGLRCAWTYQRTAGNPVQSVLEVLATNLGATTVDLTGLLFCYDNGGGTICQGTTFPTIAPFTGPTQELLITSPLPLNWDLYNYGVLIQHGNTPLGFRDTFTFIYGC